MKFSLKFSFFLCGYLLASIQFIFAQGRFFYQTPPEVVTKAIVAPVLPTIKVSPKKDYILILDYGSGFTSVQELAKKEVEVAGLRINPENTSNHHMSFAKGIQLKKMSSDSATIEIRGLPTQSSTGFHSWSPDGEKVAFCRFTEDTVELWAVNVATATAAKIANIRLNATLWDPYEWLSDSQSLLCKVSTQDHPPLQESESIFQGPLIRESNDKDTQVRTHQNLLKDVEDEIAFEYYTTSQLVKVKLDGTTKNIAEPGIIIKATTSPDGKYTLIERIHRPYSYLVKIFNFPTEVSVYDTLGNLVKHIANIPLRENIPLASESVQKAARNFAWRPDHPATLYWTEAQDGGDARSDETVRDALFTLAYPFSDDPTKLLETGKRLKQVIWCNDTIAIGVQTWRPDRQVTWTLFNPLTQQKGSLLTFSSEDRYTHPGNLEGAYNTFGREVLYVQQDGTIFLLGEGASSKGDRPFVDEYNLYTKKRKRIWQSEAPFYEIAIQLIDSAAYRILVKRESQHESANYFLHNIKKNTWQQTTFFENPNQHFEKIRRKKMKYRREDGVQLTADLYLPKDYVAKEGPLPTIITAYPSDFKHREAAQQVYGSPYKFSSYKDNDLLTIMTTQGYAVITNTSFPILSESHGEPNDTFVEQLVANAEAVVNEGVRRGIIDSSRVALFGHSYGAFMVANLLTHSRLFNAGIALSGAYNRTLTPFGFQQERRTLWDVPVLYHNISPFQQADKMRSALLLIHGREDSNSGTYPMQSERYFNALKGLGRTTRFVLLPYEDHVYKAEESNLHVYWEICRWLNIHLKQRSTLNSADKSFLLRNFKSTIYER